ncbi:sulfite exporter TauE/SafE family protein [Bacteroidota bacterium]
MSLYLYLLVVGVGIIAGFINTLAGSGSLLTLPILIFLGLPANIANGTNRIAILFQSIVSVASFKNQKVLDIKQGIWLSLPAVVGAIIGASVAVNFNEELMEKCIAGLLIFMFFVILYKPERWIKGKAGLINTKPSLIQIIVFFGIGFYGGFIQAGVGIFLLAGLVFSVGTDLLKSNGLKNFIVLVYAPFALAVFIINKQVNWEIGLILAAGNMIGAYIASKVAVSWGPKFIRIILLGAIMLSAVKLLGVFSFIVSLFK